jgi:hypothetical protein
MIRVWTILAPVFLVVMAGRADAQANPDSVRHADDCRLAAQTLSTGNPSPNMSWAVQLIPSCGDHGVVGTSIAAALMRLRFSSDTAQLLPVSYATFGLVDGSVFSAAFAISADTTASPTARAVNLVILLTQLQPDQDVSFAELLPATLSETTRCPSSLVNDVRVGVGPIPLPADAKAKAATLAQSLQNDASLPILVRVAARCVVQGAK